MTATDDDTGKSINSCANIQPGSEPNGTKGPFKVEYTLVYFNLVQLCFADNSFNEQSILLYVKTSKHQRLFRFLNQSRCASVLNNKATFVPAIVRHVGEAGAVMFMVPDLYASFYDYYASKMKARFSVPVLFMNEYHFNRLIEFSRLNKKTSITVERPPNPFVNGGFVLIVILTSLCVFLGSVWSALTHKKLYLLEYTRIKLKIEYSGTHHYDQKKLSDDNKNSNKNANNEPATGIRTDDESATETTATANTPSLPKKNKSFVDAKSSRNATKESYLSNRNSIVKSSRTIDDWSEPPVRMLNWFIVLTLFSFVVGTLLLMYFFFLYMLRFITVFYCFGATIAICFCSLCLVDVIIDSSSPQGRWNFRRLAACLQRLWPSLCHGVACVLPIRIVFCYGLSLLLVLMWYIHRMHHYAFAVHNVISMCFCIFALRCIRLPSLKWITVVFSLFFFYDVFMVFLTPFFTKTGCAIMVDVATGGACSMDFPGPPDNDTDELPLLFRMPDFTNPLFDCFNLTMDLQYPPIMIGFGDVIIPGFLVSYNLAFDLSLSLWYKPYFVVSFLGYIVGLIVTFWVLIVSGMAQPALTYLVPLTLLPTFVVAVARREFRTIWNGDFNGFMTTIVQISDRKEWKEHRLHENVVT